ncbi:MAG TPA: serine protein kinase, partial [Planctomycetota bacterium]|nr:serine protein kinase [Planctomycetota bacterium]
MGQDLANRLLGVIDKALDKRAYQELHWEGTFEDYLKIIADHPRAVRNAFQRVYDMILSYGSETYSENRETRLRYNFFKDPMGAGKDSIFGLEDSLTHLVNAIKSAAHGYGTERRILLLHGPVGSSKSTIARLIKKGLEVYSRTREGALYSFAWKDGEEWVECPMHEEPLRLLPLDAREQILKEINRSFEGGYPLKVEGELCPSCRRNFADLMALHKGDWREVIKNVKVRRLILSEKDRVGIGTFQPKDEKNQDSTELTGDINYRKIAEYGSDSDPRAFNFDGEFNIANRGIIEFIEVLKL